MKRIMLTAALLLGSTFVAHADHNVWNNLLKQPRGDYEAIQDAQYCEWKVGPDLNGVPTSAATKRCMRARGWAFDHTDLEPWTWHHHRHWRYRHGW